MRMLAVAAVVVMVAAALIADVGFADTSIAGGSAGLWYLVSGVAVSVAVTRTDGVPTRWRRGALTAIGIITAWALVRWVFYLT